MIKNKICKGCGRRKAREAFAKMSASHDGLQRACRQCQRKYQSQPERLAADATRTRSRYSSLKKDEVYNEKRREFQRKRLAWRYANDPEYRERKKAQARAASKRYYAKKNRK